MSAAPAPPSSDEVENVARAIFHAVYGITAKWADIHWATQDDYRDYARAAIAAIPDDKAELVAALREIEQHMHDGDDTGAFAMIRALIRKLMES